MKKDIITHTGEITSADAGYYTIKFNGSENCGGCAIYKFCKSNGSEYMKVEKKYCAHQFDKGDKVIVEIAPSMTWKAIFYTCLLPLLILLAATVVAKAADFTDTASALCGLVTTAAYYIFIYKFKLLRKYNLKISRLTN